MGAGLGARGRAVAPCGWRGAGGGAGAPGRGHGTAAQRALADHLFATTLIERLEAGTDVDNIAEQRALEKAGFTGEGVLRHAQFRGGRWRDLVLYSRLRADAVLADGCS